MTEYTFRGKVYAFPETLQNEVLAQIASGAITPEAAGGEFLHDAAPVGIADWNGLESRVWRDKNNETSLYYKLILAPAWAFATILKLIENGKNGQGSEDDLLHTLQTAVVQVLPPEYISILNDYLEESGFSIRVDISEMT